MRFKYPLIQAKLIKRYKRFLADVELPTGEIATVHVPNSGSMKGVSDGGSLCRISTSDNPSRKLKHTLEMVQTTQGQWVGTNTAMTNHLVREAFENKIVSGWSAFGEIQAEVKIDKHTRLDFLISNKSVKRYVEVKNVSMAEPPCAVFPDAVTERGQKHLRELAKLAQTGVESEIFFVVQREDCIKFRPCDEIDPEYGKLLRDVAGKNVNVSCWTCKVSDDEIKIYQQIEVDLSPAAN